MDTKNYKILVLFLLFSIHTYGENNMERMCGVWAEKSTENKIDYAVSITKLQKNTYFVIYTSNFEKHVLDFSTVGYEKDNKIYIRINEEREFYVVLKEASDTKHDIIYVLWNHDFPDAIFGDVPLKRVEYLYDDILQEKEKQQAKESYEKNLKEWILNHNY
ncbi:hypothetical protein H0R92_10950 [Treponema sp. OMZ 840]|uniref:hypothetical protein n=1 Tax=Treponema sp. OMZ 840 TaxID=244313 RepID=UPI003D8E488F